MTTARPLGESPLFDHLRVISRYGGWIGAVVLVVFASVLAREQARPVTYRASTDVRFVVPEVATSGSSARDSAQLLGNTYAAAAGNEAFAARVHRAGADGIAVADLQDRLTVEQRSVPGFLLVSATDPGPRGAAALADLAAAQLAALINEDQARVADAVVAPLRSQLQQVTTSLASTTISDSDRASLQDQRNQLERAIGEAQQKVRATVVPPDPAPLPTSPVSPHPWRSAAALALVAFVLTTEGIVAARYLRGSLPIGDPAGELERIVDAPVLELGSTRRRRPTTPVLPFVVQHVAGRPVVTVVQRDGEPTTLPGSMIADALSRAGSHVLLVDADLRRPLLHTELGVPLSPGVVEVATGQQRLNDSVHRSPTGSGAVVLSAGALEDNNALALALLGSGGVHTLVQRAGAETSVVLTSSATPLEDALLIVHQFPDAVLLAVDARTARRAEVVETVRVIRSIGGHIVGALCVHSGRPAGSWPWRRTTAP